MSSKATRRGDKRDRFTAEPSPELLEALEQIEREPYLTTKDGQRKQKGDAFTKPIRLGKEQRWP